MNPLPALTQALARGRAAIGPRRAACWAVGAALLIPAWFLIDAHVASAGRIASPSASRQRLLAVLVGRIQMARGVANVNRSGSDLEVILWMRDDRNEGSMDPDEMAVISFRSALHTIIWYEHDAAFGRSPDGAPAGEEHFASSPAGPPKVEDWKLGPEVEATILSVDLSDVSIVPVSTSPDGRTTLRIALTWAADRADGVDRGTADVAAVMLPRQWKEFPK